MNGTIPGSPAAVSMRRGDVLLSIDGHAVAVDGTVEFRPSERTEFAYFVEDRQSRSTVGVEVLREGKVVPLSVHLNAWDGRSSVAGPHRYDWPGTFLVFGGIVFVPLTRNYAEMWGPEWTCNAPREVIHLFGTPPSEVGEEAVVLVKVLPSVLTKGYHEWGDTLVDAVDGKHPRNMRHFVELVEGSEAPFVSFSVGANREELTLDRPKAREQNAAILARFGIAKDRSADLGLAVSR